MPGRGRLLSAPDSPEIIDRPRNTIHGYVWPLSDKFYNYRRKFACLSSRGMNELKYTRARWTSIWAASKRVLGSRKLSCSPFSQPSASTMDNNTRHRVYVTRNWDQSRVPMRRSFDGRGGVPVAGRASLSFVTCCHTPTISCQTILRARIPMVSLFSGNSAGPRRFTKKTTRDHRLRPLAAADGPRINLRKWNADSWRIAKSLRDE